MSDIIDACVEDSMDSEDTNDKKKLVNFVRNSDLEQDKDYRWRHGFAPKRRSYSLLETKDQYGSVAHSWLDNGCVLRLEEASESPAAVDLFQEIWSRGQPVVVAKATKAMNVSQWDPSKLSEDFGDEKFDLIDVKSGASLGEHSLKKFWDGYTNVSKRIKDRSGQPAVLKLSGWPSSFGDEFKDTLPTHSTEFLRTLPVSCYTGRAASLNLAASLPDTFARAEVGPRAFITYGDLDDLQTSSRLQVERADSLILCVHAQIPKNDDLDDDEFKAKVVKVMENLGCDTSSINKARSSEEVFPAAVWTVFHPADGDKIRDLLNKIAKEKRSLNYDPLLDEEVWLGEDLVKRLKDEYGVRPYIVPQFQGEAVFVPAGSPRQVKHLLSSINLESDFVSPENVSQSFFMYRQMRHVCESQKQAIVDKLSVKNLIFHSVKNAVATLERSKLDGQNGDDIDDENEQKDKEEN